MVNLGGVKTGGIPVGGVEYLYVPNGSYVEDPLFNLPNSPNIANPDVASAVIPGVTYSGVSVVPLSTSSGTATQIPTISSVDGVTPEAINSCSADQSNGLVVCTSNQTDIFVIDSSTNTIVNTLQSGGNVNFPFYTVNGGCITCGVTVDSTNNLAVIGVSMDPTVNPGMSGYQLMDLSQNPPALSQVFPVAGSHIGASWFIDTDRNLLLSPTQNVAALLPDLGSGFANLSSLGIAPETQPAGLELFDLSQYPAGFSSSPQPTPAQSNYSSVDAPIDPASLLETVAQDSTGITVVSNEGGDGILISDLSQASGTPSATSTAGGPQAWDAPSQVMSLSYLDADIAPSADLFYSGTKALAIASGTHFGFMANTNQGGAIAAFNLPVASVPGTPPELVDYVVAAMPNDPATNSPWENSFDPRGAIGAYADIQGGDAYGVLVNTTCNYASYIASLNPSVSANINNQYSRTTVAVISLPKLLAAPRVTGCLHNTVNISGITESGTTVTAVTDSPHGFKVGQNVYIASDGNWLLDALGNTAYNGLFIVTSVPTTTSFTYTAAVSGMGLGLPQIGVAIATNDNCAQDPVFPGAAGHYVDPTYNLIANGVVRFFPVHPTP